LLEKFGVEQVSESSSFTELNQAWVMIALGVLFGAIIPFAAYMITSQVACKGGDCGATVFILILGMIFSAIGGLASFIGGLGIFLKLYIKKTRPGSK
jgi:hypothetical protein